MRIDNQQQPALTKNSPLESKKVPQIETNHKLSQSFSPTYLPSNSVSQLAQLLTNMNALQRLFTALTPGSSSVTPGSSSVTSGSSSAPPPVAQMLSQLLMPQNQAALIPWLKQGAGKQILSQLLQLAAQPDSPLSQWLQAMPADKQDEFKALLRLAAEQRIAQASQEQPEHSVKDPARKDNEQNLLQLHLLQPSGREINLTVRRDTGGGSSNKAEGKPQWTVKLALPVGEYDRVHAAALWDQHKLSLRFETDNLRLLKRTEALTPLLSERLAMLGIRCEPATFSLCQPEGREPAVDGFSIMV